MKRATAMAQALVNATVAKGGTRSTHWVARNVADKALHTSKGVTVERDVHVSCSAKTRADIMQRNGVDPWFM